MKLTNDEMINLTPPNTHERDTIKYLIENGSITNMQAFHELNNTRLSATIFYLRNKGIDIITQWQTSSNGKRYGVYKLNE